MSIKPIQNESDLESALDRSQDKPVVLFKHSSACSLSASAQQEIKELADRTEAPIFRVVVQEARPVSNTIERTLNVRHETPQVIILRDGKAVFDASHRNVSVQTLTPQLSEAA